MKKVTNLLFAVLTILLGMNSCVEDSIVESNPQVQQKSVTTQDGMLVFEDPQMLSKQMQQLNQMDDESLRHWSSSMGFKSMQQVYDDIMNLEDEDKIFKLARSIDFIIEEEEGDFELEIEDDLINAISNEDGVLQVGDYYYRLTANEVTRLHSSNKSRLAEFSKGKFSSDVMERFNTESSRGLFDSDKCENVYVSNKKIKAKIWDRDFIIAESIGFKCKSKRKKRRIYRNYDVDVLATTVQMEITMEVDSTVLDSLEYANRGEEITFTQEKEYKKYNTHKINDRVMYFEIPGFEIPGIEITIPDITLGDESATYTKFSAATHWLQNGSQYGECQTEL